MSDTILRGRFRLLRVLHRGPMGVTWAGVDEEAGAPVVVKQVEVAALGGDAHGLKRLELFEREAQVLAHLDHPGIPRLVEAFTADVEGRPSLWIVQEHRDGTTLQALVQGGWHGDAAAVEQVVRGVLAILAYLHGLAPPVVHRDVTPA